MIGVHKCVISYSSRLQLKHTALSVNGSDAGPESDPLKQWSDKKKHLRMLLHANPN